MSVLFASLAYGENVPFIIEPANQYVVPAIPNTVEGATYSCIVYDLKDIRNKYGDLWLFSASARVDETIIHHAVTYAIPFRSSLGDAGGYLYGKKTGDVIENCYYPTASRPIPAVPYAWQHGNPALDLLALYDTDGSAENGYPYGIPIGAQTDYEFLIVQAHFHNPEHKVGLKTNPKFFFRASTVAPDTNAGVMVGGVYPHSLITIPAGAENFKISALMNGTTPEYEPCFPSGMLRYRHIGASEQIKYVAGSDHIDVLISGLHAHESQIMLKNWKIAPDGTKTLIDSCHHCGHHNSDNFHVLETPVRINRGDSFLVECVYTNPSQNDAIVGGFNTRDEMCRSWNLIAPVPSTGATLFFVDECAVCLSGTVGDSSCVDPLAAAGVRETYCTPHSCPE